MDFYERNMANIESRLQRGLDRLKQEYQLVQIDVGDLEEFTVQGRVHRVKQYISVFLRKPIRELMINDCLIE